MNPKKSATKELLEKLHTSGSTSPIVPKSTVGAVKSATAPKEKAVVAKSEKKRDVVAYAVVPVDNQSRYEQRYYMRDFHTNEAVTIVRHKTNFGIDKAEELCLAYMRAQAKANGRKVFRTNDLINAIDSFGPSYGDAIRNAMRKAQASKIVKIHKVANNPRTRAKYEFELLKIE